LGSITAWYGNCTALNCKALHRVVQSAQRITRGKLPALLGTYSTRCHKKAKTIIKDNNHLNHCLFTPLPSRRRGQYRCIKSGTETGHQTAKQQSLTQRGCCLHWDPITATLINGSLVTLNNATLIMFTYLTLLISYVYTVFYTIYCTLPISLDHRSSIYLYVFIHPFRFVCIK
jgi:hypothetical protein